MISRALRPVLIPLLLFVFAAAAVYTLMSIRYARADDPVADFGPAVDVLLDAVHGFEPPRSADEPAVAVVTPAVASTAPVLPAAVTDPASHPEDAVELVVSLYRRGYLAAVAHLLLFWGGLLALARWAWLVKRAPWLTQGKVLVLVTGLVGNLAVTLPAAVAGTSTWGGVGVALLMAVGMWQLPIVTRTAVMPPPDPERTVLKAMEPAAARIRSLIGEP